MNATEFALIVVGAALGYYAVTHWVTNKRAV